jgi:chloramphenicol-sensitive protein RarD
MKKGVWYGLAAYLIWGFFPIYFKMLESVPPVQILINRIIWSFIFLAIVLGFRKQWKSLSGVAFHRRTLLIYTVAAVLLAVNWLTYIWGVNAGFIVEASLGYFINPLVSVLLGVIILHERLRPMQWVPVGLAALGVLYLAIDYGHLPWIALILACTFGLYGLVKKTAPLNSLYGLTVETGVLFIPALIVMGLAQVQGVNSLGHSSTPINLLLVFSGVATAIPLLMFGTAARSIDLSLLGLLQYVAPTIQFMLGVFVYKEPFSYSQLIGFGIIWLALAVFWFEGMYERRRVRLEASAAAMN